MMIRSIYRGRGRMVKGAQIDASVLTHNKSMYPHSEISLHQRVYRVAPYFHRINVLNFIQIRFEWKITPRLVPTLEFFHSISFKFIKKYIRELGSNPCRLVLDFTEYGLKEAQRKISLVGNNL